MGLRDSIEHFRNQRKVFNTLYKRLTTKLQQQKAQIAGVIDHATSAYDQRDESLQKMLSLAERNDQDLNHFISEYKEMNRMIDHESKLQEFMNIKNNELSELAMQEANKRRFAYDDKAEHTQEEEMFKFEKVLAAIVKVLNNDTGNNLHHILHTQSGQDKVGVMKEAIKPVCERYQKTEEQNFSLFQFVNEMSRDVKRLEEKLAFTSSSRDTANADCKSEMQYVDKHVTSVKAVLQTHEQRCESIQSQVTKAVKNYQEQKAYILKIYQSLKCEDQEITKMLDSHGEVTEQSMSKYLSVIENKLSSMVERHQLQKLRDNKDDDDKKKPKTPQSRGSHSRAEKRDDRKAVSPKKGKVHDTTTAGFEFIDQHYQDLDQLPLSSNGLRYKAKIMMSDKEREAMTTPKTPKSKQNPRNTNGPRNTLKR